jgi:hypothetical protein
MLVLGGSPVRMRGVMSTVSGSTTTTDEAPVIDMVRLVSRFWARARSSDHLTSAAVRSAPLWNFTPGRRWNRHVGRPG